MFWRLRGAQVWKLGVMCVAALCGGLCELGMMGWGWGWCCFWRLILEWIFSGEVLSWFFELVW